VIDKAFDVGINFFDTADAYAGGASRKRRGAKLFKDRLRSTYVLATKGLLPPPAEGAKRSRAVAPSTSSRTANKEPEAVCAPTTSICISAHRFDPETPLGGNRAG